MESSGKPPANHSLPVLKAMLSFLPEENARMLLPILHFLELQDLLRRFRWENSHLLHSQSPQESLTFSRIFEILMEHADPDQKEQLASMQQMMELLSSMQEMDGGDMQSFFDQFGQLKPDSDSPSCP